MKWWLELNSSKELSEQDEQILSRFTQPQFEFMVIITYADKISNVSKISVKQALDWLKEDGYVDATN